MIQLKFTFIHGTEIVIFILLMTFVVLYFVYWLGNRQYRKDYEKKYDELVLLVEFSEVNAPTKKSIKEKFDEISHFTCCNFEKLQVLEYKFNNKFKAIK